MAAGRHDNSGMAKPSPSQHKFAAPLLRWRRREGKLAVKHTKGISDLHFHQNPKLRPAGIQEPFAHRKPTSRECKLAARVWLRRALRLGGTVALYGGTLALGMLWGWWATAH